jgi:ABC-type antimicrobial peptide transport system permease subunit
MLRSFFLITLRILWRNKVTSFINIFSLSIGLIALGYSTILAVVIACMGLFALSSFMVSRRTKEIVIRKTLGASVRTIYKMLSWDFLKSVMPTYLTGCKAHWAGALIYRF